MNGDAHTNGIHPSPKQSEDLLELSHLVHALEIVHDARTTNDRRSEATRFLEQAKSHSQAPARGFDLAGDRTQNAVVRHYGLSLLEYPVRYRWEELEENETATLRGWIVTLAQNADAQEPLFLRNKIGQIWVELAKRSWIDEWQNMDSLLVELWQQSFAQKEIVLHILETLSDEVFSKDDSLASLNDGALGKACVEIFTPSLILSHCFPSRQPIPGIRHGDEGWVQRLAKLLESCLDGGVSQDKQVVSCIIKILVVLRSLVLWIIPMAIDTSRFIPLFCRCLEIPDPSIHVVCVEAMHALYHRPNLGDQAMVRLVLPLIEPDPLQLLHRLYQSCLVEVDDIDDAKYTTLKKLSETLCALGSFVEAKPGLLPRGEGLNNFLDLLMIILQNPSLVVSIPILYIWTKILQSRELGKSEVVSKFMGPLLELCSQRLLRYETFPPDSTDQTYLFLLEDVETLPERHAFIGNYRRYCGVIVELVVRRNAFSAMRHILTQADNLLRSLYDNTAPFSIETFSSNSSAIVRTDSQLTVVVTGLKGYLKWIRNHGHESAEIEAEHISMQQSLEQWCSGLLTVDYQDPIIRRRVLQLCVEVSTTALSSNPQFAIALCKTILSLQIVDDTNYAHYHEAIKELRSTSGKELQKLAVKFCSELYPLYREFENQISEIASNEEMDARTKLDHQAFLFLIVQRVPPEVISEQDRLTHLEQMIRPSLSKWQDPNLGKALSSLDGFMGLLGLDLLPGYLLSHKAHEIKDWSSQPLDQDGLHLQSQVTEKSDHLPLQGIKGYLGVSTERLRRHTNDLVVAQSLWQQAMPAILPALLRFVSYAHSFQNSTGWTTLPPEMRFIVNRALSDRVWQAGISTESRDDFYARVRGSKGSLEGLASTVRSAIRHVRETSYWILHCMSLLGDAFYGHQDLPEPLAQALFTDACSLSAHQLTGLLKLSQALIEGCPLALRKQFLPPILTHLFTQFDAKITADWKQIEQAREDTTGDDSLDQEMKAESIIRQLSHSAIMTISTLLIKERHGTEPGSEDLSTRALILSSPSLLEPLVLFCTHALRMHDSRCCGIVTRVLRSLIPEFGDDSSTSREVREFFSTEVLKACITSLHEPYFADLQKDLAALIAAILLYSTKTDTPRQVLLSLPGMDANKVDSHLHYLTKAGNERQHRAYVLSFLESVRGVSIAEQGKINRGEIKKRRTAMQDKFMSIDEAPGENRDGTPDLGGVAELFG